MPCFLEVQSDELDSTFRKGQGLTLRTGQCLFFILWRPYTLVICQFSVLVFSVFSLATCLYFGYCP